MPIKRKLNNKPTGVKCKALKDLEKGMTNKDVTVKYGVPKNTLSTWVKNKRKVTTSLEKKGMSSSRKSTRCGSYDQIYKADFHWSVGKRSQKVGIILKEKALQFAKTLGIKKFKASDCWLNEWKKGINITAAFHLPSFVLHGIFLQRIFTIFLGPEIFILQRTSIASHVAKTDFIASYDNFVFCILVCSEEIKYHFGKFPVFTKR